MERGRQPTGRSSGRDGSSSRRRPPERKALRPLHSVWIDMLVLRLLNEPKPDQRRVWFVLDELASLHRLPQLHTAITENRKSNNPIIMGFQGKSQLEVIYGHLAEVMLSQPATSIFLKTKEPKAEQVGQRSHRSDRDRALEGDALRRHPHRPEFRARPADRAAGYGVGDFRARRSTRLHEIRELRHELFVPVSRYSGRPGGFRCASDEGRQTHFRPKERQGRRGAARPLSGRTSG